MKIPGGRLEKLLNAIPSKGGIIADIGCDHGKLIISAVRNGICDYGIGVDLSEYSLNKAIVNAQKFLVEDKTDFIVGNGFLPITCNLSCTVIAGLGGIEISNILSQPHKSDYYVLSPHQDAYILREFMLKNGYKAIEDYIIFDRNKFYPVIVAERGESDYTQDELFLGKNFPKTEAYSEKNKKRLNYLKKLFINSENNEKISSELISEMEALLKWQQSETL